MTEKALPYKGIFAYDSDNEVWVRVRIDSTTLGLVNIDTDHHKVHEGDAYTVSDYDEDVDVSGPKYWRITTPNTTKRIHMKARVEADGGILVQFYENPTLNVAGTSLTAYNNNRNSSNTATATFFKDSTTQAPNNDGTLIQSIKIGSASTTGPPTQIAGNARQNFEWILKQNEDYIIKVIPDADDRQVTITIEFYEV